MAPGDLAEVTFSGCMCYGLNLSYGIDTYNFSAPSVSTVLPSCTKGAWPISRRCRRERSISARPASLGLTHSDDFTAIVQKLDDANAFLYLMRAHKNEVSGGVGINAQVTITAEPSLTLDSQKFQDAINRVTHGLGGAKAAALCGDLQDKLNGKLDDWLNNTVKNGAGIAANFDAQSAKTLILKYQVAINDPSLLHQSWNYFCVGNIQLAVGAGGLKLDPGSGVSTTINRSLTIGVTFFNFFHAQDVTSYFQQTKVYITDTGGVRFQFDVGKEGDTTVNKALQKTRVHFVADAQATTGADVKLQIELSETNNKDEARHMAAIPGYLPAGTQASAATKDMQQFAASNPEGHAEPELHPGVVGLRQAGLLSLQRR